MLTPDVVVAGELLGDGLIDHFLPHLVRAGTRVLLVVEAIQGERALGLLAAGLSGVCSADDGLADLARAVLDAAAGGAVVPPPLVASIVTEWRSARRHGGSLATREKLTMREMEVFNAMADGLSTKAAARLLGVAVKTVESHRTRVFAKLGVRSQAQLVAARTGHLPEWPTTMGVP
jgi:two-component system nitrate/nitrite response regulator NarL